jgi:hypothetical protein
VTISTISTPSLHKQHHPQPPFNWRAFLPVHPACDGYPEVPREELITIGNDIRKRRLQSEIVVWRKKSPAKNAITTNSSFSMDAPVWTQWRPSVSSSNSSVETAVVVHSCIF